MINIYNEVNLSSIYADLSMYFIYAKNGSEWFISLINFKFSNNDTVYIPIRNINDVAYSRDMLKKQIKKYVINNPKFNNEVSDALYNEFLQDIDYFINTVRDYNNGDGVYIIKTYQNFIKDRDTKIFNKMESLKITDKHYYKSYEEVCDNLDTNDSTIFVIHDILEDLLKEKPKDLSNVNINLGNSYIDIKLYLFMGRTNKGDRKFYGFTYQGIDMSNFVIFKEPCNSSRLLRRIIPDSIRSKCINDIVDRWLKSLPPYNEIGTDVYRIPVKLRLNFKLNKITTEEHTKYPITMGSYIKRFIGYYYICNIEWESCKLSAMQKGTRCLSIEPYNDRLISSYMDCAYISRDLINNNPTINKFINDNSKYIVNSYESEFKSNISTIIDHVFSDLCKMVTKE